MASDHQQHTQVTSQLPVGQQQPSLHSSQLSVNSQNSSQATTQQLLSQQQQSQTQPAGAASSLDHHQTAAVSGGAATPSSHQGAGGLPEQPQQQFCLRWNNFQSNIVSSFETLLNHEELVDVTLSAEGKCVRAHKVLLSACSPYFRELFQALPPQQHPVVVLRDTRFTELKCLLCFIYHGEVNVSQDNLSYLLSLAESLKVKGLAQESTKRHGSKEYEYSGGPVFTPEREDDPSDDTDAPHGRQKDGGPSSPPPHASLSNLSALGSLLSTAATERGDLSSRNVRPQPHSSSSSQASYDRSTPHLQGRSTPSHHHDRNSSAPQHPQRLHSPSAKKRKRPNSPGTQSSSISLGGLVNSQNNSQGGSSTSPPLNNASPSAADEDHPPHAVNLSVCPPSASSPPPRLMVLKQELIGNDEESSNGDKERLERLEQRERICNLFDKERLTGMIKLGNFIDSDLEGEEEPPPPHEDDASGDIDTHGGGLMPHPLSSSLQQSFVPSYSATSHSAAAAAAAAAAHHFANTFPQGSSGAPTGSSPANWRSHTLDQKPNSPQVESCKRNACPLCPCTLDSVWQLKDHLARRHDMKVHKCSFCGAKFREVEQMNVHVKKRHGEKLHSLASIKEGHG